MFGNTLGSGVLKRDPQDFQVNELIRFEPEGQGDHLYLYVQKISANTEWVQKQLAKLAGVAAKEIGYAGLKDRHAVTRQWFSVYSPHADIDFSELPEGISIVSQTRGQRKLKTPAVLGNEFKLKIYMPEIDKDVLEKRLVQIQKVGYPNFFGQQRFGFDGKNVEKLIGLAKGKRCKPQQRGIYISAGRSYLFNVMLNERVRENTWNQWIDGDVAILNATRSIFPVEEVDDEIQQRLKSFDVHPALPLYGSGEWPSTAKQRELESRVYAQHPDILHALEKLRVDIMPRASRVLPVDMHWAIKASELDVQFTLTAGSFATTLLEQLFTLEEPERN